MNNTLYIRADGNAQIGLGHVMRCLSIALAAQSLGQDCIFLTADDSCRETIEQRGFSAYTLNSDWNHLESELPVLCAYLAQHHAQRILIDSYYVTEPYLRILCEKVRVAYLDDVAAFVYPCHTLINYNVYAPTLYRPIDYPSTQMLLGPGFAPLRPEFQNLPQRVLRKTVSNILFTTGGTDSLGMLPLLLKILLNDYTFFGINLHIVVGNFHQHLYGLKKIANRKSNIHLYVNIDTIAELMQQCDLAISAGGSTLYELCACGTPTVCFSLADNQLRAVHWFAKHEMMLYAGDARVDSTRCAQQIIDMIKRYMRDWNLRLTMFQNFSKLIDGIGAREIVKNL